jgi:Transglutaminase-like superfamily
VIRPDSPLSFGIVGTRPVFMDERDDSYFVLSASHEAEFLDWLQRKSPVAVSSSLEAALGLAADKRMPERASCPGASHSLLDELPVHTGPAAIDLVRAAVAIRSVRRMLRRHAIQAVLRSVFQAPFDARPTSPQIAAGAARFAAARRYIPSRPSCLVDSLALVRFLGPLAAGTSLVFGVKLEPFAAHCWVQVGSLLLNDRADEVERFEPVRTVTCSPAMH